MVKLERTRIRDCLQGGMFENAIMEKITDLEFSEQHTEVRKLDLLLPDKANGSAVYFIHGGGWSGGSKTAWHGPAELLADRGYVCASVDYRLLPDWKHPAQIEDVRLGMAWFRAQAGRYGFDPAKIAAMGSSAGGHLAGLLATIGPDDPLGVTPELTERNTLPAAAICLCPVVDLRPAHNVPRFRSTLEKLLGCDPEANPGLVAEASPTLRIKGDECPFLLIHGDADETVPVEQSRDLARIIAEKGGEAELKILAGVGHGFGYGTLTDAQQETLRHVEAFLERVCSARGI